MSEERLEEIKKVSGLDNLIGGTKIEEHWDWLIEQAERVEEYRSSLEHGAMVAVKTAEKLHHQQQENKRYREALEEIKQEGEFMDFRTGRKIYNTQGRIARQALEESK